jgi:hypothetical protein
MFDHVTIRVSDRTGRSVSTRVCYRRSGSSRRIVAPRRPSLHTSHSPTRLHSACFFASLEDRLAYRVKRLVVDQLAEEELCVSSPCFALSKRSSAARRSSTEYPARSSMVSTDCRARVILDERLVEPRRSEFERATPKARVEVAGVALGEIALPLREAVRDLRDLPREFTLERMADRVVALHRRFDPAADKVVARGAVRPRPHEAAQRLWDEVRSRHLDAVAEAEDAAAVRPREFDLPSVCGATRYYRRRSWACEGSRTWKRLGND